MLWLILIGVLPLSTFVAAQGCSSTKLCATGCCSEFGFCGTTEEHCGDGCQSTCDYKEDLGCEPGRPCQDGTCCTKFGYCGLGPDFCASDVCVDNCGAKSECDPGYGSEWAVTPKCPLNVCCSKWGFCGISEEFCGDKKVERPSCSADESPIRHVVGYYEGWAARRPCQQFFPEEIPTGVYSHLNFAFASVDPSTFEIVPADPGDVGLYNRLTKLKKKDSDLKVYIAIGGWAFNDPGSTASIFSNVAGSETNQRAFFTSLISFMDTYNFDGVDIDWEYPAADDRAGQPEDFENFPRFIANLKSALSAIGRSGLTITLPVSYWYLRHFDIIKLEPHVEFFNMMSYDLHGAWDQENKWVGNYLNSHTNLTEITEYLDLLWRNNISPSKVVLGLGFYSRTFRASSASCMEAGCTFSAVGDRGPCTREFGVLSNAEVTDKIKALGAESELDKNAAVRIVRIGADWITYDDEDTFKLKVDFARGECLGGVMVWAVSLDIDDGTYSKQLQKATGFTSGGTTEYSDGNGGIDIDTDERIDRPQCKWTECGEGCPANYVPVKRSDDDSNGEVMMDNAGCRNNDDIRFFCCPSSAKQPVCGWFDFNNGNCGKNWGSRCPSIDAGISKKLKVTEWGEVGSYSGACTRFGYHQVACCSVSAEVTSTQLYGMCDWRGKNQEPATCADGHDYIKCDNYDKSHFLVDAWSGSGTVKCWWWEKLDSILQIREHARRSYCCDEPQENRRWGSCQWQTSVRHDDGFCESRCPGSMVRVAMAVSDKVWGYSNCKSGASVYCCPADFKSVNTPEEAASEFEDALKTLLNHQGQCPYLGPASKRNALAIGGGGNTNSVAERGLVQAKDLEILGILGACTIASADIRYMVMKSGKITAGAYGISWNKIIGADFPYLTADWVRKLLRGIGSLDDLESDHFSRCIENNLDSLNKWAESTTSSRTPLACDLWRISIPILTDEDNGGQDNGPDFAYIYGEDDINIYGKRRSLDTDRARLGIDRRAVDAADNPGVNVDNEEHDTLIATLWNRSDQSELLTRDVATNHTSLGLETLADEVDDDQDDDEDDYSQLEERAVSYGNSRDYVSKKNTQYMVEMRSSRYPNGDSGDQLLGLTRDTHRYMTVEDTTISCLPPDYKLEINAGLYDTRSHWVTEHILELQSIPRFVDFLIDKKWPNVKTIILVKPSTSPIGITPPQIRTYMADKTWKSWASKGGVYATTTPLDLILNRLGSTDHVDPLVVCDGDLNGVKSQLFRFVRPKGAKSWNLCCSGTDKDSGLQALSHIQNALAVFNYYDSPDVKRRHKIAYDAVKGILK